MHDIKPVTRVRLVRTSLVAAFFFAASTCAPLAVDSTNKPAVVAEVSSISENRGRENRCDVSLKFTGDRLKNATSLLSVRPTHAMDDTGANICPTNWQKTGGWGVSGGAGGFSPLRGWHWEHPPRMLHGSVSLLGSSRAARSIKDLRGELELFSPTIQNGGVVVVDDFRAQPGSKLQNPGLEKLGVSLTCHTKESFEAAKKLSDSATAQGQFVNFRTQDDESSLFPGILGDPQNSPRNYIVLKASDPEKRITGFAFRGTDGRFLPVGNRKSVNDLHTFSFVIPVLPEKLDLHVYLAVDGAIEKVPFRLENIPLP